MWVKLPLTRYTGDVARRRAATRLPGYRLMLKRQQEGESMGTPAHVEAVMAMLTAAHPEQSARSWDILREVMDDGLRSIDQRLEQSGPLEPHRFSLKEANHRLAKLIERGRYRA